MRYGQHKINLEKSLQKSKFETKLDFKIRAQFAQTNGQRPIPAQFNLNDKDIETKENIIRYLENVTKLSGIIVLISILISACFWILVIFGNGKMRIDTATNSAKAFIFLAIISIVLDSLSKSIFVSFRSFKEATRKYDESYLAFKNNFLRKFRQYWLNLTGHEFENELASLFRKMGYTATTTRSSGDKGVDIILKKDFRKIIVQCKAHRKPIGPAIARELLGAKIHHNADEAILASISGFTEGVYEYTNRIRLLDLDNILTLEIQADNNRVMTTLVSVSGHKTPNQTSFPT